jgi:hypothetical protein
MQTSGVNLTVTYPSGFVYLEFSWALPPPLQAFPFPSTLGEVTLHPLSQADMFIYSSHVRWSFPLLWSFPPTTTFTSFPVPGCWACATTPAFSGWLVYLQLHEGLSLPPFSVQGALPSLLCVFFVVIAYYSIFFPGWGSVCLWGYADLAQGCPWEYFVLSSSPCGLHLPKWSGCWCLAVWEPSLFLHLT